LGPGSFISVCCSADVLGLGVEHSAEVVRSDDLIAALTSPMIGEEGIFVKALAGPFVWVLAPRIGHWKTDRFVQLEARVP
jgi:hypothetical protein